MYCIEVKVRVRRRFEALTITWIRATGLPFEIGTKQCCYYHKQREEVTWRGNCWARRNKDVSFRGWVYRREDVWGICQCVHCAWKGKLLFLLRAQELYQITWGCTDEQWRRRFLFLVHNPSSGRRLPRACFLHRSSYFVLSSYWQFVCWSSRAGYQREQTYRHNDGSYSAFGERDEEGSMWWATASQCSRSQRIQPLPIRSFSRRETAVSADHLSRHVLVKYSATRSAGQENLNGHA